MIPGDHKVCEGGKRPPPFGGLSPPSPGQPREICTMYWVDQP